MSDNEAIIGQRRIAAINIDAMLIEDIAQGHYGYFPAEDGQVPELIPEDAEIVGSAYDFAGSRFQIILRSPLFEPVAPGMMAPTLPLLMQFDPKAKEPTWFMTKIMVFLREAQESLGSISIKDVVIFPKWFRAEED
jgi:hypothetical protein